MLTLIYNTLALAPLIKTPFAATGGVPPYVFAVQTGGIGGSINSVTGLYVAPAITGVDTIVVTDATSATATVKVAVLDPLRLVCEIIQNQLGLANGRVWIWDQKIMEPTDSAMYIPIQVMSTKVFGVSNKFDGVSESQVQSVNSRALLSIDIKSRSTEAYDRKEEVVMALSSQYAETQQESNSFSIFQVPSQELVNIGELDGAAIPYRFNITVAIQYSKVKTTGVAYYNQFQNPSILTNDNV